MLIHHNNIICITAADLSELCGISYTYITKKALPQQRQGKTNNWRYHKDGRTMYLHFDYLRDEYKQRIKDKLCNGLEPAEYLQNQKVIEKANQKEALQKELEIIIATSIADNYAQYIKYYEAYNITKTNGYNPAKRAAQTCAAYMAGVGYMQSRRIKANALTFYEKLGKIFEILEIKPTNARALQRKIEPIHSNTPVQDIVTVPRSGNSNRSCFKNSDSVTVNTIKGWILQLMDGRNYTDAMIVRTILRNCETHQLSTIPSQSTITKWVNAKDIAFLSANERYGSNSRFSKSYNGVTMLTDPLHSNDVWQIDGTRVNILPHKTGYNYNANAIGTGKNRKANATDYKFLYIIVIRDVHSGDIVGEWYGYSESRWAYAGALHSACMNTGALPHTLILDHFPGWNTKEWQATESLLKERYGVKVHYTSHAQGKAQVERFFGTLQTVFMSRSNLYYGEGIKSTRPSAHRTEEYLKLATKQAKAAGFDFEKAIQETHSIVSAYRNTPLCEYSRKNAKITSSPAQLFELSDKPNQITLEHIDMIRLFGLRKELTFSRQMFNMTVLGEQCFYMLTNYEFVKNNTDSKFCIRYDADNLDEIYVFDIETDQFIKTVKRWNEPIGYGPDAKHGKIKKHRNAIAAIEAARKVERNKMIEEATVIEMPSLTEHQVNTAELTALTPHCLKSVKELAESFMLLDNLGYTPEKDAWEREAEKIKIPGIDD